MNGRRIEACSAQLVGGCFSEFWLESDGSWEGDSVACRFDRVKSEASSWILHGVLEEDGTE